ncbi:MAG: tetratricopeptide repeat protein [Succinivibrio sp.]|nr:tetratricopeptide repeat protein [Succinivibrio sp.]
MIELLFLLLPIAAAYGYYMGRASLRDKKIQSQNAHRTNYLRGVEYLLKHRQDKAVDRFIAYLNEADPTFDSRMALGNLFRQRGETDKAIALHERLASNAQADESENELARLELARDFLSAGLFDRAEAILLELTEIPRQLRPAASLLLKVYEREGEFEKAIEVAQKYRDTLGDASSLNLNEYYCELGSQAQFSGDFDKASNYYNQALNIAPQSVRARLQLADLCLHTQKTAEAVKLVKESYEIDVKSSLRCLEFLQRCYPNKADPNYRFALEGLVRRTRSAGAMVELAKVTEQSSGRADAEVLLLDFLKEKSNLKIFAALIELRAKNTDPQINASLLQLKSLMDARIASNPQYCCERCGFESTVLFWQCPSCRRWGTLKPKDGIDGD